VRVSATFKFQVPSTFWPNANPNIQPATGGLARKSATCRCRFVHGFLFVLFCPFLQTGGFFFLGFGFAVEGRITSCVTSETRSSADNPARRRARSSRPPSPSPPRRQPATREQQVHEQRAIGVPPT
jgi:hypothetical protein